MKYISGCVECLVVCGRERGGFLGDLYTHVYVYAFTIL